MESQIKFLDTSDFCYEESVLVQGDLMKYVEDLERYFREELGGYEKSVYKQKKAMEGLEYAINSSKNSGHFYWSDRENSPPFSVDKHNLDEAQDWMLKKQEFKTNLFKVQKLNHGNLMSILEDGKPITSLDITNFSYNNHIIRIKGEEEAIRMRIFFNLALLQDYRSLGHGFAQHASNFEGISSKVEIERVYEKLPDLDKLASSQKPRRSKLKVSMPEFDVKTEGSHIRYSTELNKANLEMVQRCESFRRPEWLSYESKTWSGYQGREIIKNLFGILAVQMNWHRGYSNIFLPGLNYEAAQYAMNDGGVFSKKINEKDLPVLKFVYDRSIELKDKYGSNFYPQFTPTEVAKSTGLDKKEAREHLENLTGVLAFVLQPVILTNYKSDNSYSTNHPKWFLSKSTMPLAKNILYKA